MKSQLWPWGSTVVLSGSDFSSQAWFQVHLSPSCRLKALLRKSLCPVHLCVPGPGTQQGRRQQQRMKSWATFSLGHTEIIMSLDGP